MRYATFHNRNLAIANGFTVFAVMVFVNISIHADAYIFQIIFALLKNFLNFINIFPVVLHLLNYLLLLLIILINLILMQIPIILIIIVVVVVVIVINGGQFSSVRTGTFL